MARRKETDIRRERHRSGIGFVGSWREAEKEEVRMNKTWKTGRIASSPEHESRPTSRLISDQTTKFLLKLSPT